MSDHVKNDGEKTKLVWSGSEHKGIGWEVCKWGKFYQDKPCWNTYLYIHDKEMVDALWSNNVKKYDWGEVWKPLNILEELDWHYGQTFYRQIIDGSHRYIKIGDDYQHYWDEGKSYDEQTLIKNIKHISKQLAELMTRTEKQ